MRRRVKLSVVLVLGRQRGNTMVGQRCSFPTRQRRSTEFERDGSFPNMKIFQRANAKMELLQRCNIFFFSLI
ncbi:hypothetical protein CsatB_014469 [Cannabis sativa]